MFAVGKERQGFKLGSHFSQNSSSREGGGGQGSSKKFAPPTGTRHKIQGDRRQATGTTIGRQFMSPQQRSPAVNFTVDTSCLRIRWNTCEYTVVRARETERTKADRARNELLQSGPLASQLCLFASPTTLICKYTVICKVTSVKRVNGHGICLRLHQALAASSLVNRRKVFSLLPTSQMAL